MQQQKGFTLAEAAVSLAILGIMAALTTPNYMAELQPVSYTHLTLPTIYSV